MTELQPALPGEVEHLSRVASVPRALAALVVMGAEQAGLTVRELRSDSHKPERVRARQWVALAARAQGHTLWTIGRALNRDHSTIRHAIRRTRHVTALEAML